MELGHLIVFEGVIENFTSNSLIFPIILIKSINLNQMRPEKINVKK